MEINEEWFTKKINEVARDFDLKILLKKKEKEIELAYLNGERQGWLNCLYALEKELT